MAGNSTQKERRRAGAIKGLLYTGIVILLAAAIAVGVYFYQTHEAKKDRIENESIVAEYFEEEPETAAAGTDSTASGPYRISTDSPIDGVLYIDRIDLELPIFSEVTDQNMKQSVCRVTNTGAPGCANYCLLGHKMSRYGVIFNRLHEVDIGDTVRVKTTETEYVYQITDITITSGLDYSIFNDVPGEHRITIFTCDYSVRDGRRILVGVLEEVIENT